MIKRRALVLGIAVGLGACGEDDDANQPPVAVEDLVTVDEDAPIAIEVLANDSDPEGQPVRLLRAKASGHDVTVDGSVVRVTPDANWNGTIEVNYVISDGKEWGYGRAVVTVAPVNDAPVAKTTTVATGRNAAKLVKLEGSDVDGDALTFEIESGPAHGSISGTTPELTYTPAASYVGGDTIVFRASDGVLSSAAGTVSITVVAGAAPVGQAQTVSVVEDTSKAVMLAAADADNDPVTFAIVQQPAYGTLAGTPPALTYTPAANYHGTDSFKFVADDGILTSSPATIVVNVTPANDAPVASVQTVTATEDVASAITLAGTDIDGDALTYTIDQAPAHGTLSGAGATRTYQPAANFYGSDSFTFTASDGKAMSAPATVTIGVAPTADAPAATAQSVTVAEDGARSIVLGGSDVDGDPLAFAIASPPTHGTLSGTPPAVTYTPAANFNGADGFTFTANDGAQTSAPVAITITVTAVNDVPVITGAALAGNEGEDIALPLPSTDIDGDPLTYSIATSPGQGTFNGTGAMLRYNSLNHSGNVSFALAASDGQSTSAPAMFTVVVAPMPDPPLARDDIAIVTPGQSLRVSVLANDHELDGEPMSLDAVGTPLHGTVQIDGDDLVYTTSAANTATDTFAYTVSDSNGLTATATVTLGMGEFPSGLPVRYVDRVVNAGSDWNHFLQQDISRDGRYVVFVSQYPLTAGDTNSANDVYLWDRMTGVRERISVATGGVLADGASERPSISADGRFVAFASAATNLVAGDTNATVDVFVRDRVAGTTTRVSVDSLGAQVSGHSRDPDISADGSVVAFLSTAFALVPNDANGAADVFVRDLNAGITSRVSIRTGGGEADLLSVTPVLSGDGKVVAFVSAATNLVAGDMNGKADVFIHDRNSGITERVSVSSTGGEANNQSRVPALSHDGRFVAFSSSANNLVPNSTGGSYVRDRQALTTLASGPFADHLSLSGDGRYLVGHTSSGIAFVRDRFAAQTHYFSTASGSEDVWFPVISSNGRYVTVLSDQDLDKQPHSVGTKVFVYANPL